MNTNPEITPTESPTPGARPEPGHPEPETPFAYRGNGKVARLPKPLRDQICRWMQDGLTYPAIIERLAEQGKDLTPDNLSQWRKRGFQDWLLAQAWLDHTRSRQEPAVDLSTEFDATQVNHAALQLGTLQIFEAFRSLTAYPTPSSPSSSSSAEAVDCASTDPANDAVPTALPLPASEGREEGNLGSSAVHSTLVSHPSTTDRQNPKPKLKNQKSALDFHLGGDSAAFVRLMNALARASRETMVVQKYRDACAQARAALRPLRDPNRKLTDSERRAIVREVDEILGVSPASYDLPSFACPNPAPSNSPSSLATQGEPIPYL